MAKITSYEGKLPKRMDEFVIYTLDNELIMRAKSGFTTAALKNDPKYAKSRNNAQEFGKVSSLCKQMRMALKGILPQQHNLQVVNALTKKMRQLLVHDVVSPAGERTLAVALQDEVAQHALMGYDFNPMPHFEFYFLITQQHLTCTPHALSPFEPTHYRGFRIHELAFDFTTQNHQLCSGVLRFEAITSSKKTFELARNPLTVKSGMVLTLLEVAYYFETEGSYVPCTDGGKTVLIVAVQNMHL